MDAASHPSVERIREMVRSGGGTLSCPICGRKEFTMQEAAPLGAEGGYGARRLRRAQLMCENCAYVLNFDVDGLQAHL